MGNSSSSSGHDVAAQLAALQAAQATAQQASQKAAEEAVQQAARKAAAERIGAAMNWGADGRNELLLRLKNFKCFVPSQVDAESQVLNILPIGERGGGKSSLLNAIISAVRQTPSETLHAAPSADDVTTRQRNLSLSRFGVNMGISDVPGWTSVSNWPTYLRLLRCIILGKTQDDEALLPITEELLVDLEARPDAPFDQQVHCIIVLRPLEDDRPIFVEKLKSIVQEFDRRVPVMVALTKVDAQLPASAALKNAYSLDAMINSREALKKEACLDSSRIVPMATYGGDIVYPNVPVEVLVLSALHKAQSLAEKALETHARTLERLRKKNAAAAAQETPGTPSQ